MGARTSYLARRSVEIILGNQSDTGAFIASPNFSPYAFSWMRDGSFIAYAMLRIGRSESAIAFLRWAGATIRRHAYRIDRLRRLFAVGGVPTPADFLPARYQMDGSIAEDGWPAFQPDGYAAFLWCLDQVVESTGDGRLAAEFADVTRLSVDYLRLVSGLPTFDCWEEHHDHIHPSTIACVYGGLIAAGRLLATNERDEPNATASDHGRPLSGSALIEAGRLRASLLMQLEHAAFIPKFLGSDLVDASLLWLSVPFGLLPTGAPLMARTVERIETDLLVGGGVKRYVTDTYYGGGRWILLSAWLGWYYALSGRRDRAAELVAWIEAGANERGELPEQVSDLVNSPGLIREWTDRWGAPATPLLWSHAMYLVLAQELGLIDSPMHATMPSLGAEK